MSGFICPWCRRKLRYVIEEVEFIRPFRLYPDGKRVKAGPYEEGESIFRCPKCSYASDIFEFNGFTSYRETTGHGWAIIPIISRDEAEVCVIDFCTSCVAVMFMVKGEGDPEWQYQKTTVRRIVNASAYLMRYPIRTVLTLETEVGEEVDPSEIGTLIDATRRMRGIGIIKISKTREGGQVREVEIDARKGTVRVIEKGQEMRAKISRVWIKSGADERRSYERMLMELVPVMPVTEVREG